jgi:NAD(P)-dependent dehydrogenase (short-subunit alcohol dehydrogenase family)
LPVQALRFFTSRRACLILSKEIAIMSDLQDKPVWFITGCSTGFGRALAAHTLALGYPTVVTARQPDQVQALAAGHENHALVLQLDVTDAGQIAAAVKAAKGRFGRIDVMVNNAGIGYFGSLEESDMAHVRKLFEINFWGLTAMTRAVLPDMRERGSGTIVNISSVGGLAASPGLSFYGASKFAVEALSESLSQELAPAGVKVLLVEPGPFRTDWGGRSADEAPGTIEIYRDTAGARLAAIRRNNGKQIGDPARAAAAIVRAVESSNPPLRLLLGKAALARAREKIVALNRDFDAWTDTTLSADFPPTEA